MQSKDMGGLAEVAFMLEAIKRGLHISKPVVDNRKYDFIIEGSKLYRVQVKSTSVIKSGKKGFCVNTSFGTSSKDMYSKSDIDFFAVYITPASTWYIIPVDKIVTRQTRFYPHKVECKFHGYKESWYQLQ